MWLWTKTPLPPAEYERLLMRWLIGSALAGAGSVGLIVWFLW